MSIMNNTIFIIIMILRNEVLFLIILFSNPKLYYIYENPNYLNSKNNSLHADKPLVAGSHLKKIICDIIDHNNGASFTEILRMSSYGRTAVAETVMQLKAEYSIITGVPASLKMKIGYYPNVPPYASIVYPENRPLLTRNDRVELYESKLNSGRNDGAAWFDIDVHKDAVLKQLRTENEGYRITNEALESAKVPFKKQKIYTIKELIELGLFKKSNHTDKDMQYNFDSCIVDRVGVYNIAKEKIKKIFRNANVLGVSTLGDFKDQWRNPDNLIHQRPGLSLYGDMEESKDVIREYCIAGKHNPNTGVIILLTNITKKNKDGTHSPCTDIDSLEKIVVELLKNHRKIRLVFAYEPSFTTLLKSMKEQSLRLFNALFHTESFREDILYCIVEGDETVGVVKAVGSGTDRDLPTLIFTVNHEGKKYGNEIKYSVMDILRNNKTEFWPVSFGIKNGKPIYHHKHGDLLFVRKTIGEHNINLLKHELYSVI